MTLCAGSRPARGRFSPRFVVKVTAGLVATSYALVAAGPAAASGPEQIAAEVLGQFDDIREIGALGTTSIALIGVKHSAANNGELWRSDGTVAGTQRIAVTNTEGGSVTDIVALDATRSVFSSPADGFGTELWVTDGTAAGTSMVKDLNPGTSNSHPQELTRVGDRVFFTAIDATHGRELWVTDGTPVNTTMVVEIRPGLSWAGPSSLVAAGRLLFLAATDGLATGAGTELWVTDGTAAGTRLVKDINPGFADSHPHPVAYGDGVLFSATDAVDGREVWFSDGTTAGTERITDLRPGTGDTAIDDLVVAGDRTFFRADDGATGRELWSVRRGPSGWQTEQVADLAPGAANSHPSRLTAAGQRLYFTADVGAHGGELWRTDGTPAGTALVRDIEPGGASSYPDHLVGFRSHLLFAAYTTAAGIEPWASDGTTAGTWIVDDAVAPGPADSDPERLRVVGDRLFHQAYDPVAGTAVLRTLDLAAWFTGAAATPAATGDARVGGILQAHPGAWDDRSMLSYQWLRDGAPIPGATGLRHDLTEHDLGARIAVRVTGAPPDYTLQSRSSAAVTVAAGTLARPGKPRIRGKKRVGKRLRVNPRRWEPGVTLRYRWLRNGKPIKNASKRGYKLKRADRGKRIAVRVIATKPGYVKVRLRSKRTNKVR